MTLEQLATLVVPALVALAGVWVAFRKARAAVEANYSMRFAAELDAQAKFRADTLAEIDKLRERLRETSNQLFEARQENVQLRSEVAQLRRQIASWEAEHNEV